MADKGKIVIVAALDGTFQRQVSCFTFIIWALLQVNLILLYENNKHASLCTLTVYSASLSFSLLKVQCNPIMTYSKTCVKWPLKNSQNKNLNDKW